MERDWLEAQLAAGRSIEAIAREVGRSPSTVAYWVAKYDLVSQHAARHAPKGPVDRELLERLVGEGLSSRAIGRELGVSQATVRHWLNRYELRTRLTRVQRDAQEDGPVMRSCPVHGPAVYVRYGANDHLRCGQCRKDRVAARRRHIKAVLVAEAGGRCAVCGYDRYLGALQFHHVDREDKEFNLALRGVARSLERCRAEMGKCILLCANCHAEVEGGITELPLPASVARSRVAQHGVHGPG
jgi:transposase